MHCKNLQVDVVSPMTLNIYKLSGKEGGKTHLVEFARKGVVTDAGRSECVACQLAVDAVAPSRRP